MQEIIIPTYRQKEMVLLSIAQNAWISYLSHLDSFNRFSPFYTKAFGEAQLERVNNTLKNFDDAEKEKKQVLVDLKKQTILLCQNWQLLKRYIQGAYPKRFQSSKLKLAGKSHYFNAYRYHFESVIALVNESTLFLKDFKMLLTLEDNMPLTFVEEYYAICDKFNSLLNQYTHLKESDKESRFQKIKTLNQINQSLAEMFNDGKAIFVNDKKTKSLFTFGVRSVASKESINKDEQGEKI